MSQLARPRRADLHVHSTASDGDYTPSQVVALARQAGLCAVALTDHDTFAGVDEARTTASMLTHPGIEVVPAVEITTVDEQRELHLLGYYVDTHHAELIAALAHLCEQRRVRFHEFLVRLREHGCSVAEDRVALLEQRHASLGRRHVAKLLVESQQCRTRNEAFQRYLGPLRGRVGAKAMLPVARAIELVHAAGGIASLAHPPTDFTDIDFDRLKGYGLDALESEYAWGRSSARTRLRECAMRLNILTTGGSDCHGPEPVDRRIGTYGISFHDLGRLRERAESGGPANEEAAVDC